MANNPYYEEYAVVKGPSKFDLMLAVFEADRSNERQITFNLLEDGTRRLKAEMTVFGIHREKPWETEELWDITGEARFNDGPKGEFIGPWFHTRVEFSTRHRRGTLRKGKPICVDVRVPGPDLDYCHVRLDDIADYQIKRIVEELGEIRESLEAK